MAVELDCTGSLQWKHVAGTTGGDIARAMQLDASGNVILAGGTGGVAGELKRMVDFTRGNLAWFAYTYLHRRQMNKPCA